MIFTKQELEFVKINKPVIQNILQKKLQDILDELLLEKDPIRTEVLKLWARETKDLVTVLQNFKPLKDVKNPHSGI
jgi:hypothetical protein